MVKIEVNETHTLRLPPELGLVSASITFDGPEPEPVMTDVTNAVSELRQQLDAHHDASDGPITRYSIDQVRSTAHRPWNDKGEQLPLVHTAAAHCEVEFNDFAELGAFIARSSQVVGFSVTSVDWRLTDEHQRRADSEARKNAASQARSVAQDYADAFGLDAVEIHSVWADPTSREGLFIARSNYKAFSDAGDEPGGSDLLKPQDLEITATVRAKFTVAR